MPENFFCLLVHELLFFRSHFVFEKSFANMYDQSTPSVNVSSLDNPMSLESYCIDFICDHLDEICVVAPSVAHPAIADQVLIILMNYFVYCCFLCLIMSEIRYLRLSHNWEIQIT